MVVEVNDRGAGDIKDAVNKDLSHVLDLSRSAMAVLLGVSSGSVTDSSAGVINIERIEVVPPGTPLGPWEKK